MHLLQKAISPIHPSPCLMYNKALTLCWEFAREFIIFQLSLPPRSFYHNSTPVIYAASEEIKVA